MSQEIFKEFGHNPIELCKDWLQEATNSEINDPEAVNLATADKNGRPSNRWVLIKEITQKGFKFHTNENSKKGRQIAENPYASICFYWKSTRKQIRIEGRIEMASSEEANEYFQTRSIERQIGAWASKQSSPFEHWDELEAAIEQYEDKFADTNNIPRPPYWKGYRLIPESIEFWIAHKDRLHKRFIYSRENDTSPWTATWLCP
ncbi:MAG: pyridoxamine 5'-phosphate oxidase [Micavibrio sp.]|nr:pyridoxamine 5'-phosphate oxidase [Micavibrio sp.]|tara:strand:+ start:217 stop:828 length:612 start_codon:yes stop_codon:yes gene_type:complete